MFFIVHAENKIGNPIIFSIDAEVHEHPNLYVSLDTIKI